MLISILQDFVMFDCITEKIKDFFQRGFTGRHINPMGNSTKKSLEKIPIGINPVNHTTNLEKIPKDSNPL